MSNIRTLGRLSTAEMRVPRRQNRIVRVQMRHEDIATSIRIIYLKGRLDILGVEKIETQFIESIGMDKSVIVDLSEVELMSSVGLGMLITGVNIAKAEGRMMILFRPQSCVERVIRIAGLEEFLPIESDLKSALKRIKANRN